MPSKADGNDKPLVFWNDTTFSFRGIPGLAKAGETWGTQSEILDSADGVAKLGQSVVGRGQPNEQRH
jgi:hypothetical protein